MLFNFFNFFHVYIFFIGFCIFFCELLGEICIILGYILRGLFSYFSGFVNCFFDKEYLLLKDGIYFDLFFK